MIQEQYVDFETAKLLKEKGFDVPCRTYYRENGEFSNLVGNTFRDRNNVNYYSNISAPTQQMACAWLREEYNLFICIGNDDLNYNWQVLDIKNRTKDFDPTCLTESYGGYDNYEQAVEAGIKYCLENLI